MDVEERGEGAEGACMLKRDEEIKACVNPATDADLFMPVELKEKHNEKG